MPCRFYFWVASELKTASSVEAVRMASPQASNAGSVALLNFSVAHTGNAPKRRSKSFQKLRFTFGYTLRYTLSYALSYAFGYSNSFNAGNVLHVFVLLNGFNFLPDPGF